MRIISTDLIDQIAQKAMVSPRKRANYNFHQPTDSVQRMLNVLTRDTYVPPHRHRHPPKTELFAILEGQVGILQFNDQSELIDTCLLDSQGNSRAVDILPDTWHSILCLSSRAAVLEIIQGPYDPETHKEFAPFAPTEDDPQATEYLAMLRSQFHQNIGEFT